MKKLITVLLTLTLLLTAALPALAATDEEYVAAQRLYSLGLFKGRGTDGNGNPDFDLDSTATREEAVVMMLRLENCWQADQPSGDNCPFTDVSDWARGYLYYAYVENLVKGRSETFFDARSNVTAAEYLTMVLRALWYHTETTNTYEKDFDWDKPWLKSDEIGLTHGEYNADTTKFTRGDMARISSRALDCTMIGYEDFTVFGHINSEGFFSLKNELELNSGRYSDGEKLYSSPRLRMLSVEFVDDKQLYAFVDDLYLLLAAATGVLEPQADGAVSAAYTQNASDRNYSDYATWVWVRDYGTFGMEHYTESAGMSGEARRIIYSIPADNTHVRSEGAVDAAAEAEQQGPEIAEQQEDAANADTADTAVPALAFKISEEPTAYAGPPGSLHFRGTVRYFHYSNYDYINEDNENYSGFWFGYPAFVNANDFLAYFGFDCTLTLTDSAEGYVWSLTWNDTAESAG